MARLIDSGYEITQMRNAFIAAPGNDGDFDWTPDEAPSDFLTNLGPPPTEFREAVDAIRAASQVSSELELTLQLARHLSGGPGPGPGLKSNTRDAYRAILSDNRGYCSDYTQVLNGLAYAADIPIREWGMSFDNYSGYGHGFSEIYDRVLDQWVFVDSFYSLYVVDADSGRPLSALELRGRLAADEGADELEVRAIRPERFGFKTPDKALDYYRKGADQFYLYYGNNVFSYDAHPLVSILGRVSRALEETAGIFLGIRPEIRLVITPTNADAIEALFSRRRWFLSLAALAVALFVALVAEARALRMQSASSA